MMAQKSGNALDCNDSFVYRVYSLTVVLGLVRDAERDMRQWMLVMGVVLCVVVSARAQLKAAHLPSDAAAVVCVDLKELNASPMGAFIQQSLDDNARRGLSWLQSAAGINLTNDVDYFVAYTQGKLQTTGVVQVACGRFDVAKLTALVGGGKEFQNKALGERSLLSWREGSKRRHLCFIDPTMVILSWDEAQILEAVARVDGAARGAEGEGPFAQALSRKKGRFLAAQANSVAELAVANPKLQMLKQADALLLEVGQLAATNGLDCTLMVKASTKEQAQQMQQAAQGIQALLTLQAAQNPDAAAVAQSAQVALQDEVVVVSLRLPEDLMRKMIQVRVEQQRAAHEARRQARQAQRKDAAGANAGDDEEAGAKKPERPAF